MKGKLYLVATPIGNLEDITLRAIRILQEVDLIVAEDTRHTLKLLNHLKISKQLISYHRHSNDLKIEEIVNILNEGKNIALVTDAGTPAISDPGEEVVKKAIENQISIIPIPGACALINGLIASGIDTSEFTFIGFLPTNKKLRKNKLEQIKNCKNTFILYEAPHNIKNTLIELSEFLKQRKITIAKELTKIHESYIRGNILEVIENLGEPKGEYVIIIEKNNEQEIPEGQMNMMTIQNQYIYYEKLGIDKKEIIKKIAKNLGVPKDDIYKKFIKKENN